MDSLSGFFCRKVTIFKRELLLGENSYIAQIYMTYTTGGGDQKLSKRSTKVRRCARDSAQRFAEWPFCHFLATFSEISHFQDLTPPRG